MFEEQKVWLTIRRMEEDGRRGGGVSLDELIDEMQTRYFGEYTGRNWVQLPLNALILNGTAIYNGRLINTLHSGQDKYANPFVFWAAVSEKFGFWKIVTLVGALGASVAAFLPHGVVAILIELFSK